MNRKDLYIGFNNVDDDILERSESVTWKNKKPVWQRLVPIAACFCLVIAIVLAISGLLPGSVPAVPNVSDPTVQTEPRLSEGTDQSEGPWNPWEAHFNKAETILDAARVYIPGYFTEELNVAEITVIEPGMRHEWMQYSGYAGFDGNGNLININLAVTTTIPENNISVIISQNGAACDYVLDDEPVISVCGDVAYKVYQWHSADDAVTLVADAAINGYTFAFKLKTFTQNLEQAKEDFTRVLECFAYYADGKPDLSAVTAESIPEWFDDELTHEGALEDQDYGAYMLQILPEGFTAESIRRYKNQTSDYLSGLWTSGYDEIRWKVYTLSETDEVRITSVTDTENYDLSLYPIPRASSVPEELREVVDNPIFIAEELTIDAVWARAYKTGETGDSSGWRMAFSVKYGGIIVEVRTKGVDPEWVYKQLIDLIGE